MELHKEEKVLFEMPFELYYKFDGKKHLVKEFVLTNKCVKIKYKKKITLFKREDTILVINLSDIRCKSDNPNVRYEFHTNDGDVDIVIYTNDIKHIFVVTCFINKKRFIKKYEEFYTLLRKNYSFIPKDEIKIDNKDEIKKEETKEKNSFEKEKYEIKEITVPPLSDESLTKIAYFDSEIKLFFEFLGETPNKIDKQLSNKIKKLFPLPIEQEILWSDCEFHSRCSGIVCTNKGVFIKSKVSVLSEQRNTTKEESSYGESVLYYLKWENFDPVWFSCSNENNLVLSVSSECQDRFIFACNKFSESNIFHNKCIIKNELDEFNNYLNMELSIVTDDENSIKNTFSQFYNSFMNNGENIKIKKYIISKYYSNAKKTLESFLNFDGNCVVCCNNQIYNMIEVPKEQYSEVLKGFEKLIIEHRVMTNNNTLIFDVSEASKIIKKGEFTFSQVYKLAQTGKIDGLEVKYDEIMCSFSLGVSSLIAMYISYRKYNNYEKAVGDGIKMGCKVIGMKGINYVLFTSLYKTIYFSHFSGNAIITNSAITSSLGWAIYTPIQLIKFLSRNISFGQFLKNIAIYTVTEVAAGTGGLLFGKIGGAVAGDIGEFVGTFAGAVGAGLTAQKISKSVADTIKEDDIQIFSRLFVAMLWANVNDYLLDEGELEEFSQVLNGINEKEFKSLFNKYFKSKQQEEVIENFISQKVFQVIKNRNIFKIPTDEIIVKQSIQLSKSL